MWCRLTARLFPLPVLLCRMQVRLKEDLPTALFVDTFGLSVLVLLLLQLNSRRQTKTILREILAKATLCSSTDKIWQKGVHTRVSTRFSCSQKAVRRNPGESVIRRASLDEVGEVPFWIQCHWFVILKCPTP